MQGRLVPNTRLPRYIYWETLFEYTTPTPVSTLTVLLSYTDFGSEFADLSIFLSNTDVTNPVTLVVEPSHGGAHPLDSATYRKLVAPSTEEFVQVSYPNPFTYMRISALTASPAFPTVNVQWAVLGLRR